MREHEEHGFFRLAVAAPELQVADCGYNLRVHTECLERADDAGTRLVLFPELSLTGYSCGDLFHQRNLLTAAHEALVNLAEATSYEPLAAVVGVPIELNGRLFNCAAFLCGGDILGLVPKTYLPNRQEFYEPRWFTSGSELVEKSVMIGNQEVPIGTDLLFHFRNIANCRIGIELCEDLWSVEPPSGQLALGGANILLNLSASDALLGKADYRRELVRQQSARCLAAYAYACAGPNESTTDLVYPGHGMVAENGQMLVEQPRFCLDSRLDIVDVDVDALELERLRSSSFAAAPRRSSLRMIAFNISESDKPTYLPNEQLNRPLDAHPFVPRDAQLVDRRSSEIFTIQATGLARRLRHLGEPKAILGLSGGLDSTLALLVTVHAFERLERSPQDILVYSMPGPGTSDRTRGNARSLAEALGVGFEEISIVKAVEGHLEDIGHPAGEHDITFENAQARERTQILMDLANRHGGLVVGTSDLSEAALGWCTFAGDHMSMYHVNIGVPKTLVRSLVRWCSEHRFEGKLSQLLEDVIDTPISPELLPPDADGKIAQQTEDSIGPYELHDFFLYQTVRKGFTPAKTAFLARFAFADRYQPGEILRWLEVFYRRFFAQQFKRSSMPDGPKVGTVALSPRGDWRMPSDASPGDWLAEIQLLQRQL